MTPPQQPFKKNKLSFIVRVNKAVAKKSAPLKFCGDSGAEAHVISSAMFKMYEDRVMETRATSSTVQFGTGPAHAADAEVDIGLLNNALVVQRADKDTNLISLARYEDNGGAILIKDKKMYLFPAGTIFESSAEPQMIGEREGGLYCFDANTILQTDDSRVDVDRPAFKLCKLTSQNSRYSALPWHHGLSHCVGYRKLADRFSVRFIK